MNIKFFPYLYLIVIFMLVLATFCAAMASFPASRVTCIEPFSTISMTEENAFGLRRSVGEMKLPAALLITISGTELLSTTLCRDCFTQGSNKNV